MSFVLTQGMESSLLAMSLSMYSYFWAHDGIKKLLLTYSGTEVCRFVPFLLEDEESAEGGPPRSVRPVHARSMHQSGLAII